MAVTQADVDAAKQEQRNRKNQENMEIGIYGKPVPLPGKPGDKSKPVNLPGKPTKAKFGEGMTNYRKGGYVKAADGIAKKGKTKGRIL
jgi:hypothetical protein